VDFLKIFCISQQNTQTFPKSRCHVSTKPSNSILNTRLIPHFQRLNLALLIPHYRLPPVSSPAKKRRLALFAPDQDALLAQKAVIFQQIWQQPQAAPKLC